MTIYLLRHAAPAADPHRPAAQWPLTAEGVRAARGLGGRLDRNAVLVCSNELKARQTLELALPGLPVAADDRFGEVRRTEPFDGRFRERRLAWVDGRPDARHVSWETPQQAARRFAAGVAAHRRRGRDLVIATHGMVLTAWLVHEHHWLDLEQAAEFWAGLRFPDVVSVPDESDRPPTGERAR